MKFLSSFFFFLIFVGISYSQKDLSFDTTEVYTYYNKAKHNQNDSNIIYFIKTLKASLPIYIKTKSCSIPLFNSLNTINNFFYENNRIEKVFDFYDKISPYIKSDCSLLSFIYEVKFKLTNNYAAKRKTLSDLKNVLNILKDNGCRFDFAKLLLVIGNYYYSIADYTNSIKFYQLSYQIFKKENNFIGLSKVLNNFSIIHIELKNYKEAEKYLSESIALKKRLNDKKGLSASYNNFAMIYSDRALLYLDKNQKDSAELFKEQAFKFYSLSKQIDSVFNDYYGIFTTLINEASLYLDFGEYNKSLAIFNKIEKYINKNHKEIDLALYFYINVSDLYIKFSEDIALTSNQEIQYLLKAKNYLEKAKKICEENYIKNYNSYIFEHLYRIYNKLKDYKKALDYAILWKNANDSLLNQEKINYVSELEKKFQVKEQQKHISTLKQEKLFLNKQRNLILFFSILFIITLSILIYQIYKRLITTNKQNKIIHRQNEKIQILYENIKKKNEIISQSISYAKNIQESFLVDEQKLCSFFKDAFIIFMPKDILSGDFYYFNNCEKYSIIALGDCAGHGIPGSIMTFVNIMLLNQIIEIKKIYEVEKILAQLDEELLKLQTTRNEDLTESTELSICIINKQEKSVQLGTTTQDIFLWIDGKYEKVNGGLFSLGQNISDNKSNFFNCIKYTYKESIRILFSTDGIYDEYNKILNKKFSKQKFENILNKKSYTTLSELKEEILSEYKQWNDKNYQMDDVSLLCIEI